MKKILVLTLVLVMVVTVFTLVACGESNTTTAPDTTTTAPDSTVAPGTTDDTTSSGDTTGTTVPDTSTNAPESSETTAPESSTETTPESSAELKPNRRDPAQEYHEEQLVVKTNNKNQDEELGYLWWEDAGENPNERYADNGGFIIYRFDVSNMIEPKIILRVRQMYAVYIVESEDEFDYNNMIKVADFNDIADNFPDDHFLDGDRTKAYTNGGNAIDLVIDPYEYEMYGSFSIHICNARPDYGWGGTISQFTISQWVLGKGPEVTIIDNSNGTPNYKPDGAEEVVNEIPVNGEELDADYIFENTSALTDTRRYADNSNYLIYRIDLRKLIEPTVELLVAQNYKIEVSPDGKTWVEVANYGSSPEYLEKFTASGSDSTIFHPSGDYLTGDNFTTIVIDPYVTTVNGEALYGNLYIKISDCFPTAGWGGAVEKLTIKHYGIVE